MKEPCQPTKNDLLLLKTVCPRNCHGQSIGELDCWILAGRCRYRRYELTRGENAVSFLMLITPA